MKIILPLIVVATTSVIGFFLGDHIRELRREPTLLYALDEKRERVVLTLTNVSSSVIERAGVTLSCDNPVPTCFASDTRGFYRLISEGPVTTREISEVTTPSAGQIDLELVLQPDARLRIETFREPSLSVPIHFGFTQPTTAPVRLVEAGSLTAYVVRNYLLVLAWGFVAALGVLAVLALIGLVSLVCALCRPSHAPSAAITRPNPDQFETGGQQ